MGTDWLTKITDADIARVPVDWRQRAIDELMRHPTTLKRDTEETRMAALKQEAFHMLRNNRSALLHAASKLTLKPSQEILDEEQRRAALARLERAQAARWVGAVRAAGEAVPVSAAPAITPDTVWSGDFDTLVELFHVSLYRVNVQAAYFGGQPSCGGVARHALVQRARAWGRTHDKP